MNAATSVSPKKSAMVSQRMRSMMRITAPMATQSEVPDLLFLSLIIIVVLMVNSEVEILSFVCINNDGQRKVEGKAKITVM